jgi:hypothetical protein
MTPEIRSIIASDHDRLFVVDHECCILYTGESTDDLNPFIRVGTWHRMPAEVVPLVENIIIPDQFFGDPLSEARNVDISRLRENRFIGSRQTLKRYLAFQKDVGLDLSEAGILEVESDLPEFSGEQSISARDHFIGLFYRDGNFVVNHARDTLLDLKSLEENTQGFGRIYRDMAANDRAMKRYEGKGLLLLEGATLLYGKGSLAGIDFPANHLETFSRYAVNPANLSTLFHSQAPVFSMSSFLKSKCSKGGSLQVYSDQAGMRIFEDLYGRTGLKVIPLSEAEYDNTVFQVRELKGSGNLLINMEDSTRNRPIRTAYLREKESLKELPENELDLLIVRHELFRSSPTLFRSTTVPVIVTGAEKDLGRIRGLETPAASEGIQYELELYLEVEDVLAASILDEDLLGILYNGDRKAFNDYLAEIDQRFPDPLERSANLFNVMGLCRFLLKNTSNRGVSSSLKQIYGDAGSRLDRGVLIFHRDRLMVTLRIQGKALLEEMKILPVRDLVLHRDNVPENEPEGTEPEGYERIRKDRRRLMELVRLYLSSKSGPSLQEHALRVSEHREAFRIQFPEKEEAAGPTRRRAGIMIVVLALVMAAALVFFAWLFMKGPADPGVSKPVESREEVVQLSSMKEEMEKQRIEYDALKQKYDIQVSETEIFQYASRIARENGYSPLTMPGVREKNPHWIFPGNVFVMHDGEKIVVREGDTLWDISRTKLERVNLKFYSLVDTIPSKEKNERQKLMERAREMALTDEHRKVLERLERGG